ncbi:MAG: hypothetical protein ACTSUE_11340, partial [Promethearchaeota archaeon]
MARHCPYCSSTDLKEEDDRSKPPISYIPTMIYPKKFTCKKCRKSFSKEDMEKTPEELAAENQVDEGVESEPKVEPEEEAEKGEVVPGDDLPDLPEAKPVAKPAPKPAPEENFGGYQPTFASIGNQGQSSGFNTVRGTSQPAEKKSYMQVMKEKSQYQKSQFQSAAPKPVSRPKPAAKPTSSMKPRPKPAAKPTSSMKPRPKPAAKPVAPKPAAKPVAPKPSFSKVEAANVKVPEPLPALDELPDLPSVDIPPKPVAKPPVAPVAPKPVAKPPVAPVAPKPVAKPPVAPVAPKPVAK